MTIRTYKVTLDTKNSIAPEPVFLRQGDKTGAVVINATLIDNGSPVSLSGLTPMFKANTADGQAVIADSTGFNIVNASGGEFTYQVPNALSAVPGKITTAYFSFSDSSGSESTFDVAFVIKKAVDITQEQADDYITIIDGTLKSLQQKIDAMNTDVKTVLNAYNQGDFYNKSETDSKVKQAVDNLQIGGRNYLLNSDFYLTSANAAHSDMGLSVNIQELAGKTVTLSLDIDVKNVKTINDDNKSTRAFWELKLARTDGGFDYVNVERRNFAVGDSYGGRITRTTTIPNNDYEDTRIAGGVYTQGFTADSIKVGRAKLELGNKATGWSPAPEDSHHLNWGEGLKVIAHRGNNAEWPENSLPAFRHTGRFWGIETDTTVTSDGTWVIMHDDTVDRMTNGTGAIKNMTYAQIAALRLDAGNNLANCRDDELIVPRVSDYLRVCKEINKVPILEIKDTTTYTSANYDNLASVIRGLGWESQMWIISFGFTHLQEMRKRIPNLPVQWLVRAYSDAAVDKVAALGANVAIDTGTMQNVTDANVAYAHNKGVMFNVWTGDDGTNTENLANIGVDFLTKDGLSGGRKYTVLTLKNGWKHEYESDPKVAASSVAQIGSGYVHLSLNVKDGTTTKGIRIAQLPDWATPYKNIWANCIIRTDSSVALGTIDIVGANRRGNDPRRGDGSSLLTGVGWDQIGGHSWAAAEVTYYTGW